MIPRKESFDEEKALRAWQRFVQMGELMPYVPALIARSWFRCKKRRQPALQLLRGQLPGGEAEHNLEDNFLHKAFQQTFQDLAPFLDEEELLLTITDPAGVLLGWQGNQKFILDGSLEQGLFLQEKTLGTAALSITLRERETCFVQGAQHYYSCYHQLSSFAIPLTVDGNFRGALGGWSPISTSSLAVVAVSLGRQILEAKLADLQ